MGPQLNDNLRDAITYCALAAACFVFSFLQGFTAFLTNFMVVNFNVPSADLMLFAPEIILALIPLGAAIITFTLLLLPLWHNQLPSGSLFVIMGVIGFVFGLVVAGVLIFLAYSKIYWREKPSIIDEKVD
jgi:hypothetical protein